MFMHTNISHNNAVQSIGNSHYHAIALKSAPRYREGMSKSSARDQIAKRHRQSIRRVMAERGLQVAPWCRLAGMGESTLRNFLNGDSDSMGANTLEILAHAAGVSVGYLLGEEIHYKVDNELMNKSIAVILSAAKSENRKLSRVEEMAYSVMLYNHLVEYRRRGEASEPNEAIAALILKSALQ